MAAIPGLPLRANNCGKLSVIAEGGSPGLRSLSGLSLSSLSSSAMPVYHFTLHAYRSWSPAHRRGYTKRGKGYQRPDPERAKEYDHRAKFPKVVFDRQLQEVLIVGCADICRRRGWRLHAVGTDPSHFHFIVSWRGFLPWRHVMERTKNLLSLFLGRATRQAGRRWFVVNGSRKRVMNAEHLRYLVAEYLPDHRGAYWCEGRPLPAEVLQVLKRNAR